jgi:hypothetical protein
MAVYEGITISIVETTGSAGARIHSVTISISPLVPGCREFTIQVPDLKSMAFWVVTARGSERARRLGGLLRVGFLLGLPFHSEYVGDMFPGTSRSYNPEYDNP